MYTYRHIISRLTEADKIRMLTDLNSLSGPDAESWGIPRVTCASLGDGCLGHTAEGLPAPALLARSWDVALMRETAAELTRRLAAKGVNHILLPPAASAITPDGVRLSEDPFLSGHLAGGVLEGTREAGLTSSLTGYGFTPADKPRMDDPPSPRFVAEHVTIPARTAAASGFPVAIMPEDGMIPPESLARDYPFTLRAAAHGAETVTALLRGEILVKGSSRALISALHTYRRLKTAITEGKASTGELETAIAEGEAMSPESLDGAVDRLIAFAEAVVHGCNAPRFVSSDPTNNQADTPAHASGETPDETAATPRFVSSDPTNNHTDAPTPASGETPDETAAAPQFVSSDPTTNDTDTPVTPDFDTAADTRPAPPPKDLRKRALEGATVLLENRNGFLPLVKPTRICILGDAAREGEDVRPMVDALTVHGHTYLGYARGYDLTATRDDAVTAEAVALAKEADTVLVFVQTETGKTTLPAAQRALLDHVSRLKKKTAVILSANVSPDMGFLRMMPNPPEGLLLIPAAVQGASLHGLETLLGDATPCGHLTETLTDATHPACDRRGYAVGPFVGYRYYDTLCKGGCGAVYPFGHGLGYTTFRYSNLRVDPTGTVTFTVTNTGKRTGTAIPQIYLGIRDSALLRPRKELAGFTCIPLAPKEQKTVTLTFRDPLAPFTGMSEKGRYELSVGESVSDIRLTADFPAGEAKLPPDGKRPSDYLPSITNIHTERYTLEAATKPMKPSVRNLIFGIAAIVLAVSIKLYDILTVSNSLFLNIVAILLAVGSVCFFATEITDRKHRFARERAALEEANAALFTEAQEIPVPSADALFSFVDETVAAERAETAAEEQDHFMDVNKDLTVPVAEAALTALASESGLVPEGGTVRAILSAMLSSRLILTRGMENETFTAMIGVLAEYFGCPALCDGVDDSYTDEAALLCRRDENGEITPRAALQIVESARRETRSLHVVALTDVSLEKLSDYFVPYARYARAPHVSCAVQTHDADGNETACLLPENLWFILNLRDGESLGNLPAYIAEVATLLTPAFTPAAPADTHSEFASFRYGQVSYLCDRLKAEFSLSEDTWKRIDRLEAYAARFGDFAVTNKLWLGLETYLAAAMTGEPDPATALDEALAARLMPALITALSGKLPREERSLAETLEAVLDGNATLCRRAVKESGADLI